MWEAAYTASKYVGLIVVESANTEDVEIRVSTLRGSGKTLLAYRFKDCELEFVRKNTW